MIEAVPVLFVAAVAMASYVAARHVANPANQSAAAEIDRLRTQRNWLQTRLQRASLENWDQTMVARLTAELESTETRLIALDAKPPEDP